MERLKFGLLFLLGLFFCLPAFSKPYFAWVNKPLVLPNEYNHVSVSGYAAFGSDQGKGGGLGDVDLGFEPHGVLIRHGFGTSDVGIGYSAFFSNGQTGVAPFMPDWPAEMSGNNTYAGVIGLLFGLKLVDWVAFRASVLLPTQALRKNGVGAVLSMPFRWVLSPGLLEIHLIPSVFLAMGGNNGGYKAIMTRAGVGFSLLPEILLQQDVVFFADLDPAGNPSWSTVTSLGWQFNHGLELLIRYTYKAIDKANHAQYVSLGLGVNF